MENKYRDDSDGRGAIWYGTPEEEAVYIEYQRITSIPTIISMTQCQFYLTDMPPIDGRLVIDIIEQDVLPTMSKKANIEWRTRNEVWRSSPMVEQMRLMFGWTVEQMDQMFLDASLL